MKLNKTSSTLLACLAGACLASSQATAGQLLGSVTQIRPGSPEYSATTDLTAEGTADWIFWEETHATPTGVFDHKAAGADTNSISELSLYGAVGPYYDSLGNPSQSFSWTDGMPNNPSTTGMQNSFANGPSGNGLQFTVAADTRTKYLKVYSGGYDGIITCQATLSDNSAPPINLTVDDTGDYNHYDYFTIQFAANSANQTLTVAVFVSTSGAIDGMWTTVSLAAASLQTPPPAPQLLTQPSSSTNWVGLNQQFSVTPGGALPWSCQWWKEENGVYVPLADGGQISGSTTSTLTISNLVFANATNYYVVISNSYGSVTSSVASVTILQLAGALSGAISTPPALVDLTAGGKLDWIVWGYPDENSFDRKSGVVRQISDITMTGAGAVRDPDNGFLNYTWSDGTTTPVTNTDQSIYFEGGTNTVWSFTVPAGRTPKVLVVYAGAWNSVANLQATLSDNSAPPYVGSFDTGGGNGAMRAWRIHFAAGSDGQTLTVTGNVGPLDGADGGLELGAATLAGPAPLILTPPASSTNWVGQNQQFSVAADGAPSFSYQWWKESGGVDVPLADGGQISGSKSNTLTINNLVLANATNYYVVITNAYGSVTSSVATLTVLPITGALIGASPAAPATVDLTALGALDWAAWGLNVATDFDQKAGGPNQISNFTLIGPGPNGPFRYNNALAAYSWSNGTPDPTAAATTTGVYFNGLNNGYQITVPADETKRILTVYAGGWNTTVHLEAALSDLAAPTYVNESLVTAAYASRMAAYTIEYAAGSPAQTLTINVYCATDGGNVTLMAARLNGPQPLILAQPASCTNWVGLSQHFSISAMGWPTLGYQWWREANGVYAPLADGGHISGSTTPTLTINNLVFANATNYCVVVTNAYGSVTSSVAYLTVLPPIGTMQGSVVTDIASLTVVNLTAQGTLDWADWGLADVNDFNDKAVGGVPVGLISNWALYGTIGYGPTLDNYSDQPYGLSWTDGTPTATATTTGHDTANYVYVGSLNSGFQITVPADTTKKMLKLYYMGWNCRTRVMATLSDNSAPTFINDSVDDPAGNIAYGVATIVFAAGSAGQTLTVTEYDVADYGGGNVGITAATLARPQPINVTASRSGVGLQLTWPYGTLLQATNVTGPWTVNGNASPYAVTPSEPRMFYRVQVQ
jgi:Tfp pilus assembly protein PilX